ncbi:MAG TPA: SurA N-terminal domain-containing protein, partial [Acetobacteraceae bacterium]|nr:SurA N-terminal domain-containing protein [Acetobacteraceae bacterium]
MKPTPDVLNRLKPQITQQLIDQTLQMQEISKLKVNVPEADIATAIGRIEQGNNLPPGGLKARMPASGVAFSTLVAQIRTELGWQAVLHQV